MPGKISRTGSGAMTISMRENITRRLDILKRMLRLGVYGLMLCLSLPIAAAAQDTVDGQLWVQVVATLRLSENWRLHLEEQPRWYQNWSEPYQVITRTALGRRFGPRARSGEVTRGSPSRRETASPMNIASGSSSPRRFPTPLV